MCLAPFRKHTAVTEVFSVFSVVASPSCVRTAAKIQIEVVTSLEVIMHGVAKTPYCGGAFKLQLT